MAGDMGEDISVRPHSEGLWNTEAAQITTSGMICNMAWHAGMQNLHCRNNIWSGKAYWVLCNIEDRPSVFSITKDRGLGSNGGG